MLDPDEPPVVGRGVRIHGSVLKNVAAVAHSLKAHQTSRLEAVRGWMPKYSSLGVHCRGAPSACMHFSASWEPTNAIWARTGVRPLGERLLDAMEAFVSTMEAFVSTATYCPGRKPPRKASLSARRTHMGELGELPQKED